MSVQTTPSHTRIAVIGAGLSGLGMAIALRRDGDEDFVVLERASELGGTWRDNRYPGCACDIPSVLYCYADEPNPQWTRTLASQPEIWAYMRRVADEHDVRRFMRFDEELVRAAWDGERQRWSLHTSAGERTCEILVLAAGALVDPAIPELPGLDTFAGTTFHSARWDEEHDLAGRRVAVIGTGASAIQFVPEIQPEVGRLTLFQRTPPWVLPRENRTIPASWRGRFARHPRLLAAARAATFAGQEATHVGFRHPVAMRGIEAYARWRIARQIPDRDLRRRLIPRYRLGCKRVLFSTRWYRAIAAPNSEVVTSGIREVVPEGIVDGDGVTHAVDTIIFATGFHVTDTPIAERVVGRDGVALADVWRGSPLAHLGMAVRGYPNLFFLLGPGTGLGHNSVLLMIEAQIDYLRRLLAHRERWGYGALEPTAAAQAAYLAELERRNAGSVWTAGGCESWYLDRTGRQSTLWPGSVVAYQRRLADLDPGEYEAEPAPAPAPPEPAVA